VPRSFRRLVFAALLAVGSLRSAPAQADPPGGADWEVRVAPLAAPELAAVERSQLAAGEIVLRELAPSDAAGVASLVMAVVDASPAQVWRVMADCDEQDEYMPRIASAAVRDRAGDDHTCDLVIDLPFPADDARSTTRQHVRRLPDGGYQRLWQLAPGPSSYERYSGSWSVHPFAPGERALLVNRMDVVPKSLLPRWLLSAVYRREAPAGFEAIRVRVRERQAR
jgi:hypothetical protein